MASFDAAIPPGGRGRISLRIHTGGMSGPLKKGVIVHSNAALSGRSHLIIRAMVKPPFRVEPTDSPVLRTRAGRRVKMTLTLISTQRGEVDITGFHSHLGPMISGELGEVEPGRVWKLTLTLDPDRPVVKSAPVELKLKGGQVPNFMIYTRVEVAQ